MTCGKNVVKKNGKSSDSLVMLSTKSLEVEPIMGVLQELSIRVNKGVYPFSKATVDDVWAIPH